MRHFLQLLHICSAILTATAIPKTSYGLSYTIETTNGRVTGHPARNASSVVEFLGIPYAQPPVGSLRFAAPQRHTGFGHYEASNWGYDCPLTASAPINYPGFTPQAQRIISYFATGAGTPQSEDCLTLNVWTRHSSKGRAKAVLVFFYGGRFTIGNTNSPFYNGQYLAKNQDLVVFSVNYRVNVFGFPGAPGLERHNLGLRDQRLAVEWIRDNAASFGGDASKITILGQSSGGVAADWWSYAYREEPIVNGFIATSGNAFSFPLNELNITLRNWYNVSATLGCGSEGDTLACMRTRNWTDIKAAAARVRPASGGSPLRSIPPFYPVVDNETVFPDYLVRAQSGNFAKVPFLQGNNDYEQGYYKIPSFASSGMIQNETTSNAFLLSSFTCPISFKSRILTNNSVPVYTYRYFGDWDNSKLYPDSPENPGGSQAYHGTELQMVFGSSEDVSGLPESDTQKEMVQLVQKAVATFADDPANGLQKEFGWPARYEDGKESLVLLAKNNVPEAELALPSDYDAQCANVDLAGLPD